MVVSASIEQLLSPEAPPFPLSSRPERTRISYFALLATSTYAALLKESRMQIIKAAGLDRKSRRAQRREICGSLRQRDLQCASPGRKLFFYFLIRILVSYSALR
jgi:hypothetical protein